MCDYDVVIVGAGSGGIGAALTAGFLPGQILQYLQISNILIAFGDLVLIHWQQARISFESTGTVYHLNLLFISILLRKCLRSIPRSNC